MRSLQAALGPLLAVRSTARVRGGTRAEPLCATCPRPDPGFWRSCPAAGRPGGSTPAGAPAAPRRSGCVTCSASQTGEHPPRTAGPLPGPRRPLNGPTRVEAGSTRAPPRRSCGTWPGSSLTHGLSTSSPPASRSSTCAASWSPSGRCRRAMSRWPGWNGGSPGHRRPPRPRRAAAAAPLRRLAPAAPAPAAAPRRARPPTTRSSPSAARPGRRRLLDWLTARDLTLADRRPRRPGELDGQRAATHRTRRRATSSAGPAARS